MPNYEEATAFLSDWWGGKEMPRPVLRIRVPTQPEQGQLMPLPEMKGIFCPQFTLKSADYRVAYENNHIVSHRYFAEGMAVANNWISAGSLALHLGCEPIEDRDTVWHKHRYNSIHEVDISFNEKSPYFPYQWELTTRLADLGKGRFVVRPADTVDGLDILASLLCPQQLVYDLIDYPDLVMDKLIAINDIYLSLYDKEHEIIRDKLGGSHYILWAPGKMYRGQCDFASLLSPEMFREYAVPEMKRVMKHMNHIMFHWDGPGALCHLDALLDIDKIEIIQWVPGAGNTPGYDRRWWNMYHKIIEAGKRIQVTFCPDAQLALPMKKEFGKDFCKFMFTFDCETEALAIDAIDMLTI